MVSQKKNAEPLKAFATRQGKALKKRSAQFLQSNRIMIEFYHWHSHSLSAYEIGDICPTLQAGMGMGGGNNLPDSDSGD